jgi:hypothetical protein
MAIHAPSRTRVRFAVAVLSAVCAFHAVVHAASPVPDGVSLSESTITWSTVNYATNAENGFVSGSLDKKTIFDRAFKTHVLENRYLKVMLLAEFGGRILSIIYKPTGHEQLYRTEVGVPYGIKGGILVPATPIVRPTLSKPRFSPGMKRLGRRFAMVSLAHRQYERPGPLRL